MTVKRSLLTRGGIFFEAFEVGQSAISAGRTVTEADVVAFAGLTGDWSQIHTDAVYAAQQPLGKRVAHGLLGLSIASALAVRLGFLEETLLVFREIDAWKFSQPIFLGDTIHVRISVNETRPAPRLKGGLVSFQVEVFNQDEQVVQQGIWRVLVKSQASAEPEVQD